MILKPEDTQRKFLILRLYPGISNDFSTILLTKLIPTYKLLMF